MKSPVHAAADPTLLRLSELRSGDCAEVLEMEACPPALLSRLAARGLMPGVSLRVLRGGDPLLVQCEGSRWGMTRADAATIDVVCTRRRWGQRLRKLLGLKA